MYTYVTLIRRHTFGLTPKNCIILYALPIFRRIPEQRIGAIQRVIHISYTQWRTAVVVFLQRRHIYATTTQRHAHLITTPDAEIITVRAVPGKSHSGHYRMQRWLISKQEIEVFS